MSEADPNDWVRALSRAEGYIVNIAHRVIFGTSSIPIDCPRSLAESNALVAISAM